MRVDLDTPATARCAATAFLLLLASCGGAGGTDPDGQPVSPAVVQQFSGNNQQALGGTTLPEAFVVEVLGAMGEPVGGTTVTFAVASGGGSLSSGSAVTNASGQARSTLTLGRIAGVQTVTATVGTLQPATFTATAVVGPPAAIVVVGSVPSTGTVRQTLPVTVRLTDAGGNGIPGATITANAGPFNGGFTPAQAVTNAAGEVSGNWQLDYPAGQQSATFVLPSNTAVIKTITITALAAAPASIELQTGSNQTGDPGDELVTPLTVRLKDAFGNLVSDYDVSFSVMTGGGSTAPATAKTDANGQAKTKWTLGPQSGLQSVRASVAPPGTGSVQFDATALTPSTATLSSLNHRVLDAEYAPATNRIVTVSANPSRLTIVDPETKTERAIDLAQVPLSVSINPSGTHAAVSHDGWLSYVNLTTEAVERVAPVSSVGGDVVLAGNGFAYVFPRSDQWVNVHCIAVATGVETIGGGYGPYAGALIKLHPSGDFIYSASNGLSPSDFEKYDIRGGTAVRMYDSPYHGDYQFSGNLWISGDGTRLFARSGNVFRSSTAKAEDMLYAGRLQGLYAVQGATHPANGPRIYVLGTTAAPPNYWTPDPLAAVEVSSYEPQYLGFKGSVPLPKFKVPNGSGGTTSYQAQGRFIFANTASTRVYVLVQAPGASGIAFDWAVAAFDAAELP